MTIGFGSMKGSGVIIPEGAIAFLYPQLPNWYCGLLRILYTGYLPGVISPEAAPPGCEADPSPPSSGEFTNNAVIPRCP